MVMGEAAQRCGHSPHDDGVVGESVLSVWMRGGDKSGAGTELVMVLMMADQYQLSGRKGRHTAQSDCSNQGMCRRISKEEEEKKIFCGGASYSGGLGRVLAA
jgi:hypothetical protein